MSATRWLIALVISAFGLISYCSTTSQNPITGAKQHISMTPQQEIALGRQLAPQMASQMGGALRGPMAERVRQIGERIVQNSTASRAPYKYDFYLLADPRTVNAFALPGGQVFITEALLRLLKTEDQVACVLGH